jgi:hypothetical protein
MTVRNHKTVDDPTNRNVGDKPRADGRTDKDVGVPAADFRNGTTRNDPEEWVDQSVQEPEEHASIFESGLDSGDDTVIRISAREQAISYDEHENAV